MAKRNYYYFVARDRDTNEFSILNLGTRLEEIDLYTVEYNNKTELLENLKEVYGIDSLDNDIYIVSPKKDGDHTYVNYFNVLYSDSKDIKDISKGFIDKNVPTYLVENILDKFLRNMQYSGSFYDMVMLGKTNLYQMFTNYFIGRRFDNKLYDIKYKDGCWVQKSYPLIRNIYDSFSIFYDMHTSDNNSNDNMYRKLIENELLCKIGEGKDQKQTTLYRNSKFNTENGNREEKRLEIVDTFNSIDRRIFKYVDRKVVLDTSKFDNISGEDLGKLKNLLDQDLMTVLYYYYNHRNYSFAIKNEADSDRIIKQDQKAILKLLNNKTIFDNAYSWITVYNKYMLGEEYGKQKIKGE